MGAKNEKALDGGQYVSVRIDPRVWIRAKIYSVRSGYSPSVITENAISYYMDAIDEQQKKEEEKAHQKSKSTAAQRK